ncbi:hypothetical protein LguiA_029960 [Lonicera macranthoides]
MLFNKGGYNKMLLPAGFFREFQSFQLSNFFESILPFLDNVFIITILLVLAKGLLITPMLMLYNVRVYVVENRKNPLTPFFQTLYHTCKLNQTPFPRSVVFGEDRDRYF